MIKKILLAEDDIDLGDVLCQYLNLSGFSVILARDGQEALDMFEKNSPLLCILDVMMPKINGFEVAAQLLTKDIKVPFIFLTAKNQKEDIIKGLEMGADDYISKPFEPQELLLRINNILKRQNKSWEESTKITLKNSQLYPNDLILIIDNVKHHLTVTESKILIVFFSAPNKVIKKEQILEKIWGKNDYFNARILDVYINRIRKFLDKDPFIEIQTIRGVGYKIICQK